MSCFDEVYASHSPYIQYHSNNTRIAHITNEKKLFSILTTYTVPNDVSNTCDKAAGSTFFSILIKI